MKGSASNHKLTEHLSPLAAWAFALGTAVGWGSLVVTGNTYLAQAGPWGSILGLIIGAAIMILISRNYAYLMQIYPESGGAYAYSREAFSHDHGFLVGWFLAITYLAVLWANATSLPLFARNFIGPVFQFVPLYTILGYDVYLGEILLTFAAILLTALLCTRSRKLPVALMIVMACVFSLGILAVFLAAVTGHGNPGAISPAFLEDTSALSQVIRIAVISPWAFIGFESISHYTPEFSFKGKKIFRVLVLSVISATVLYILVTFLSVTAYPDRYDSWLAYIRDHGNLSGLEAFPGFYAAHHYMGSAGVGLLMAALLALVISSLIGNTMALSRLFHALGKDEILPKKYREVNEKGQPANAIWLIVLLSLPIPFVGRTAIGWIVDVTTIGATLIYGFVSAAAWKTARLRRDRVEKITGAAGLLLMLGFGAYLLLPSLVSHSGIERETFFLFVVWTLLGFLFFRNIIRRDQGRRFGKSLVVWVSLVSLVLFISVIWMRQSMISANERMVSEIETYYQQTDDGSGQRLRDEAFFMEEMEKLEVSNIRTMLVALGLFSFALFIMLSNHHTMTRRSLEHEAIANIDPMTGTKSKHAYLVREKELNAAIEEKAELAFAVAVCDVNGLKRINDTQGHKAGDEYICAASRMVCEIFTHSPVYRIGGDEFIVIMTGRDYDNREELMRMLHDLSVVHIGVGGVVVSGGLAVYLPEEDTCYHDVFERADQQMYEEKKLLKGLGSVSREEEPQLPEEEEPAVLHVRKRVMVVEDSEINQQMLSAILEKDYDVLPASDGLEALDILQQEQNRIDVMLLDLQMPRMDGRTLLMRMRADPDLRAIPVIVVTGDEQAEVECLRMGAIDFLPKPYPTPEIIHARVSKCIELSETRAIIQSTERDPLTGLYNLEFFNRYVDLYDKHYADMPMDAVFLDVNRFHMINERYGREYADGVLRRLGVRLRKLSREIGGVSAHQSADAFLLYCPHRDDYPALLSRLSEGLSGEPDAGDRVRLRMGVYAKVDKSLDIDRRFDRAKMAADAIRDSQVRSIGTYDDEMHQTSLLRDRLLEDFRPSLEQGRFQVFYQPKFDIRPDRPVLASAEALVRWNHPEMGMVQPSQFIPLLEESGLISELDRFVWEEAADHIADWKKCLGVTLNVSVNVSRVDMLSPDLPEVLKGIVDSRGLSPRDLILEITESAYTGNSDHVIAMVRELRGEKYGFRVEMDDFGTGYSSLGMLTNLPIDALKLDMTFVRSAFGETRDLRMIKLILEIADHLQVPVIAEGVETEEQLQSLRSLGCHYVQGYYFSRPVPPKQFEHFLQA